MRAGAAGLGGTLHETFDLTLPRFVRRSRLYEVTAKNLLRVMVELVGGVEGSPTSGTRALTQARLRSERLPATSSRSASIFAFGFSPLWLLAAALGPHHGSRVYLKALEDELKTEGVIDEDINARSMDEFSACSSARPGRRDWWTFRLDLRELSRLARRAALQADSMPSPSELAALLMALLRRPQRRTAGCSRSRLESVWLS